MSMRNLFILLVAAVALNGCADAHRTQKLVSSGTHLTVDNSICISVPEDGVYGDNHYNGSGATTAQTIKAAFLKRTDDVRILNGPATLQDAAHQFVGQGCDYLVFPTILHWEDRATEWSGKPDRVEVKVVLVDLNTEKTLESVVIKGRSGLSTLGGDHPQNLLPEPVEEFISSLY